MKTLKNYRGALRNAETPPSVLSEVKNLTEEEWEEEEEDWEEEDDEW